MKKLVTVTNNEVIATFKMNPDITLLYPLKDYSIGYEKYYNIKDIDGFCLINRLLTDSDIDKLEKILLDSNIKGIVFDDLGLIEILKAFNITKILLLDHLSTNVKSINYYLEYVDSVVVSNDITKEEIEKITKNAIKPVVIYAFGLKTLMYSRRNLLSNYEEYHKLEKENTLTTRIDDHYFKIIENEYGTKFYAYPYYNALELLELNNVLYFWYDPIFLNMDSIENIILDNNLDSIPNNRGFLDTKTIYKVGDIDA